MALTADILRGYPKETGLEVALRTLSPEVIVCDELSQRDFKAVQGAVAAGVPGLFKLLVVTPAQAGRSHTGRSRSQRQPRI